MVHWRARASWLCISNAHIRWPRPQNKSKEKSYVGLAKTKQSLSTAEIWVCLLTRRGIIWPCQRSALSKSCFFSYFAALETLQSSHRPTKQTTAGLPPLCFQFYRRSPDIVMDSPTATAPAHSPTAATTDSSGHGVSHILSNSFIYLFSRVSLKGRSCGGRLPLWELFCAIHFLRMRSTMVLKNILKKLYKKLSQYLQILALWTCSLSLSCDVTSLLSHTHKLTGRSPVNDDVSLWCLSSLTPRGVRKHLCTRPAAAVVVRTARPAPDALTWLSEPNMYERTEQMETTEHECPLKLGRFLTLASF